MKKIILKLFLISILIAVSMNRLYGQDLIVTSEGDSINCKITKIKHSYTYFNFIHAGEFRSSLLSADQIKSYQYEFYPKDEQTALRSKGKPSFPHARIVLSGGYSYSTPPLSQDIPSDFKDFYQDLRNGGHWRLEGNYFFTEFIGIGFTYNRFTSSNSMDGVEVVFNDGVSYTGSMSAKNRTTFIGPSFISRYYNSKKRNCFIIDLGIGYMDYYSEENIGRSLIMKGNTIGMKMGLGYDIALDKNWALGIDFSYIMGTMNTITLSDGIKTETVKLEDEYYIGLSHLNLGIGIRYNL